MDWRYLAGFFDGEGNIHINFIKNGKYLQMVCRIYSSERLVIEEIQKFLGFGKVYQKRNGKNNIIYEFVMSKKENVNHFLENITAFLILKKPLAEYVLRNYNFERSINKGFNIENFRSCIKRKNAEKLRKVLNKRDLLFPEQLSNTPGFYPL